MNIWKRLKNLWEISKFHPELVGKGNFKAELISPEFKVEVRNEDGSVGFKRMATIVEDELPDNFEENENSTS